MGTRVSPPRWSSVVLAVGTLLSSSCAVGTTETRYDFDEDGIEDGADCAPAEASIYPGAPDAFGDEIDQDCDGADGVDTDGDGFPSNVADSEEYAHLQDCNDANATIYPGAPDVVGDGVDHNCDNNDGVDQDGDGDASVESGGFDCDDADPLVSYQLEDPYGDGVDSNCDGGDGEDWDEDGYPSNEEVAGEPWFDCDDFSESIHPGAEDLQGDEIDSNCDGVDGVDADGDGSSSEESGGDDCDDADAGVHPGVDDPYDEGGDTNCDGSDGIDADGDTYPGNEELAGEEVYDCNDTNPAVNPGMVELLSDGLDNDCDGVTHNDDDGDTYVAEVDDCDDTNALVHPAADEVCGDDVDNDCNGETDDGGAVDAGSWYEDSDGDTYGAIGVSLTACTQPLGFVSDATDCDDDSFDTNLAAIESCDGADNNCDGVADEGFPDTDGDTLVDCVDDDDDGDGDPDTSDCDDANDSVYTGAEESANGVDDDCDLIIDEGTVNYDDDGDGYSETAGDCDDTAADNTGPAGTPDGIADGYPFTPADPDSDGYTSCTPQADCEEGNPNVYPGHPEDCDGVDNNCDTQVPADEADDDNDGYRICEGDCDDSPYDWDSDGLPDGAASTPYDGDGDTYTTCSIPIDCNNSDGDIHPNATEFCDGVDSDCEGDLATTEADTDVDGYVLCSNPVAGWTGVLGGDDCDDSVGTIHPGATDLCNGGVDDDCDSSTDETDDADGDGSAECEGDCDDTSTALSPWAADLCGDSIDNDCSGAVDDQCLSCDSTVPTDHSTVGAALLASSAGDTVCIEPGNYNEFLTLPSHDVQLVGTEGRYLTFLSNTTLSDRLLTITAGSTTATLIQGLTIHNGGVVDAEDPTDPSLSSNLGGCVLVGQSGATFRKVALSSCNASFGGAIAGRAATIVIDQVVITQAVGQYRGGGIFLYDTDLTATDLYLTGCFATQHGGGIFVTGESDLTVEQGVFDTNYAGSAGGGLACEDGTIGANDSVLDITQSTFYWNQQSYPLGTGLTGGGGVAVGSACQIDASHTQFLRNAAVLEGGGLLVRGGQASLSNVIFHENAAASGGAAISVGKRTSGDPDYGTSQLDISFATVTLNDTFANGGGLEIAYDAEVSMDHCLLSDNTTTTFGSGFDVYSQGDSSVSSTWASYSGLDYAPVSPSSATNPFDWVNGTNGNFLFTGGFVDPALTGPEGSNLHLSPGSSTPSTDGIDEGAVGSSYDDPDGGQADIGAYGGPAAGDWDRDGDGSYEYWQPGAYQSPYSAAGWDCEDFNPNVNASYGCAGN